MAIFIAIGATAANSADFTLVDGQTAQLSLVVSDTNLMTLPPDCQASVQSKTSQSGYLEIGRLTGGKDPVLLLEGPGTYRIRKPASTTLFGVDKS